MIADPNKYGVSFRPYEGVHKHSYADWNLYMGPPSYGTKQPKEVTVSIPWSSQVLDYSRITGLRYYDESSVTYTFFYAPHTGDQELDIMAMAGTALAFESYCWAFYGDLTDDYMGTDKLECARCVSFHQKPDIAAGLLTIEATFKGVPHVL